MLIHDSGLRPPSREDWPPAAEHRIGLLVSIAVMLIIAWAARGAWSWFVGVWR